MNTQTQEQAKQKPIANFRDGAIQVAVWPRQGPNGPFYELERTRSYKDKNDAWQKTTLISDRDMLKARRLEDQAYDAIQKLKEQNRALAQYQQTNEQAPQQGQEAPAQQPEAQAPADGGQSLAQAKEEAMANMPEPQPALTPEPSPDR